MLRDSHLPMFKVPSDVVTEFFPSCASVPSGDGGSGSANCAGYPAAATGWSGFTQIIAPGDAWAGARERIRHHRRHRPAQHARRHQRRCPVPVPGQRRPAHQPGRTRLWRLEQRHRHGGRRRSTTATIWARVNSGTDAGDIESFPLTVPSGQVPTLNAAAPATLPAATGGTILVDGSGSAIQVLAGAFPTVTATGPLSASACTAGASDNERLPWLLRRGHLGRHVLLRGPAHHHRGQRPQRNQPTRRRRWREPGRTAARSRRLARSSSPATQGTGAS